MISAITHIKRLVLVILTASALLPICGCSDSAKESADKVAQKSEEAVAATAPLAPAEQAVIDAFYKSKPEFFTFATIADLPKDLIWEDGHDEKPFADPRAVRGGTINDYMLTWPPTLRLVGPDANHSMRDILNSTMGMADLHPITKKWTPCLAKSWSVSKDKRTVYFRLDPDARYSDGVPVKADDYLYLFYFMQSPFINDPWYNNFYEERFHNITKYDDYTISLTLSEAKPDPMYYTTLSPMPSHFFRVLDEHYVEKYQWLPAPVTGPWELCAENIKQGTSITMTRVKNWWANDKTFYAHRYNPDKIRYTLIREMPMACESFKKGDLDMFDLSNSEYWYDRTQNCEAVKKGWIERATFYNDIPRPTLGLYLNRANPLLADKRIRQGIQYACNWQRVIDFYFRGDYQRLKGEVDGYDEFDHPTLRPRPFDVEKARALFAQAGFTKAGPDGILVNDKGQRLSFAISIAQGPRADQGVILKEEALKAGLEFVLDVQDATTIFKKVTNKQHDISYSGWVVGGPYPRFWEGYHSVNAYDAEGKPNAGTNNLTTTAEPELDKNIEKYDTSDNLEDMKVLAHQMEEFLYDEASFVPGCKMPFYREGYWTWIRFPEYFDMKRSSSPDDYGLYWIDQDAKQKVLDAKKNGKDLGEKTLIFGDKPQKN